MVRDMVKKKINGVAVDVRVSQDGEFTTLVAGVYLRADTLKDLLTQAKKALRQPKKAVAVPATIMGTKKYTDKYRGTHWAYGLSSRNVVLTGIHGGTGRVVSKDAETGAKLEGDQFGSFNGPSFVPAHDA